MKKRVRAILFKNDSLILIHRKKDNKDYYVFPGGGVKRRETEEKALLRELKEELGIIACIYKKDLFFSHILNNKKDEVEKFYLCSIISGKLGTGDGPEFQENNQYYGTYSIECIPLVDLSKYNILPRSAKKTLISYINSRLV